MALVLLALESLPGPADPMTSIITDVRTLAWNGSSDASLTNEWERDSCMKNTTTLVAQVFWGLLIVAIDVHLGRFDVLPDFAGYVLVALGAAGLVRWSRHFQAARLLSWILVPVSASLLVFQGGLLKLTWILNVALDGALMWFLLGGVMAFAESRGRHEWVSRASICRRTYLGLLGAGLLISWIAPALPTVAKVLGSVTFVAMLFLMAVILYLLHQVKGEAMSSRQPDELKEAA